MDWTVGYQRSRDMMKILSMTCGMAVRRQVSPEMPYISRMNWRQSVGCEWKSGAERNGGGKRTYGRDWGRSS